MVPLNDYHQTTPIIPCQGIVFLEYLFYTVCMNTDIELKTGNWLLVMGPRKIVPTLLTMTARLAEAGASAARAAETADGGLRPPRPAVRVVDGGNLYNVYPVARAARGRTEVLERISVSRAFSCYQVLTMLESMPAEPVPFVVLDLLRTFYDQSVWAAERKRLLRKCLTHLDRLEKTAGGLVSVHPPRVLCQTESELLEMVQAAARDTYRVQMAAPASVPMGLF